MANPSQLFLLADHIKLSLLERQRAISLNLEPNSQDGHISRSLESLQEGIEAAEAEQVRLEGAGDDSAATILHDHLSRLRSQHTDLSSQFHGASVPASSTLTSPNDPTLAPDFSAAQSSTIRSSSLKRPLNKTPAAAHPSPKSVRFTDHPPDSAEVDEANRSALLNEPYRDDPDGGPPDQSNLTNEQIHTYHSQVLAQQDEQLDQLGDSVGRQRQLAMQVGDELEGQVALLDEVDGHVDRHVGRLEGAKRRLGRVGKKAGKNWGMTTIIILIVVLVLLIVILK